MKRLTIIVTLLMMFGSFAPQSSFAQRERPPEYLVKAGFLYQFLRFTHWPGDAFESENESLKVCVAKGAPINKFINAISGKEVNGRKIAIIKVAPENPPNDCHALFVGVADTKKSLATLDDFAKKPILTVGEDSSFSNAGGVINFVTFGPHIRFEINIDSVKSSRLEISSELLKLAIIKE